MTKLFKEANGEVCTLQEQCNNPFTLYEEFQACQEIFPDVAVVLEIIQVSYSKWSSKRKRVFVSESYYE